MWVDAVSSVCRCARALAPCWGRCERILGCVRGPWGAWVAPSGSASESGHWQLDACCVCVRVFFSATATRSWGGAVLEFPREGISSFWGSVKKRG